jgi:hypothetical protein
VLLVLSVTGPADNALLPLLVACAASFSAATAAAAWVLPAVSAASVLPAVAISTA